MPTDGARPSGASAAGRGAAASSTVRPTFAGVIGGIYLVYMVGWIVSVVRLGTPTDQPFTGLMHTVGGWFAVFAPLIWFGVTLVLTRRVRAPVRIMWFLLGVVVLIPWPFVLGV